MKEDLYLTFSLNNRLYGINTVYVEEIFALPELSPSPEGDRSIVGVVNFRGDILPIVDLNLRLGYQSPDYRLTDSIVLLRWEELRVGIIVNAVHEMRNIAPQEITAELYRERDLVGVERKKIIAGIAKSAGDILILSNLGNWVRDSDTPQLTSIDYLLGKEIQYSNNADKFQSNGAKSLVAEQPVVFPNATPEERAIFRQRADNLMLSVQGQELKNLRPLAVIVLNGNFFGIDLNLVREFIDIERVIPIPCCPAHIIGNMNLRSEILTLVDICQFLNLPPMGMPDGSKAAIVEVEGIVAGVMVEEVRDAMFFLNPLEIRAIPRAIYSINYEYFQGVAEYQEEAIAILDLPKIFLNGGLIVDEAI